MRRSYTIVLVALLLGVGGRFAIAADVLSKAPRLTHFVKAIPPADLPARGSVSVVLAIDIDARGTISKVDVEKSGGAEYDAAALAAVKQFVFEPGEADGKPIPVRITYEYKFTYKAPPPAVVPPANTIAPTEPTAAAPPIESPKNALFSGAVLSRGERVPQSGVTLLIDDGAQKTVTNDDGTFSFATLSVGKHVVKLRGGNIANAEGTINIVAGKRTQTTFHVDQRQRYVSVVRGKRVVQETVQIDLSGEEIRRIPGTQGDLLKAVQNLPGVARAPFGGGALIVWGSSPQDTRTYVDGVEIPTLFHFGGLRSTVNSEMVSNLSFIPGGYGVEYGRGNGGVVEIDTRAPRSEGGVHGFAQLDLIDFSALVEAKLPHHLSIAIGVRRSVLDWLRLVPLGSFTLAPTYYDYQFKLNWKPSSTDEVELFVFGSDDQLSLISSESDPSLAAQFNSHIYYHRALVKWIHRMGKATLTLTPSVGYQVPFQFGGNFGNTDLSVSASAITYTLRMMFRVPIADWLRLDAGLDYEGFRWAEQATAPISGRPVEGDPPPQNANNAFASDSTHVFQNLLAPNVALHFAFFKDRLVIVPQLRLDLYTASGYIGTPQEFNNVSFVVEPRLNARYQIKKWLAVKGSVGIYHQPADPSTFLRLFGNPKASPEYSQQYVFGFDVDPYSTLHIEAVGFYKDLRNLVERAEKASDPLLFNDGIGRVYGGDILIRQQLFHNFFGWVAYTISKSERKDHPDQPWRTFQYDQTHILTIIGSYKLPRGYQLGMRFRYTTGNPYTPVIDHYYDAASQSYYPRYGQTYSSRLANFNQLDVRFDKTWTYNRWKLSLYLDIENIYNYRSQEGISYNYDFTKTNSVQGLPFLPALGLRGEF